MLLRVYGLSSMSNAFQWNCFNLVVTCNIALILFLKCDVTKFRILLLPFHTMLYFVEIGRAVRRNVTLYDKEGWWILNFVTSHFKNSIKAILHVTTKLKQFHWKALNVMTFNVHLAQSFQNYCFNLIKLQNMWRHTR